MIGMSVLMLLYMLVRPWWCNVAEAGDSAEWCIVLVILFS